MNRRAPLATLVFVTAAGCGAHPPPEAALQAVRVGLVTTISAEMPDRYAATIVPMAQVDLAFKSAGPVDRVMQVRGADGRMRPIQAGDRVAKDDELAAVRSSDYDERVQQARAQTRQTQAQLALAQASVRQAEADFGRARTLLSSASITKPEFDQAQARLDAARAAVESADAAIAGARAQEQQALLAQSDTAIRAPFAGIVTARNVDVGALAGSQTPAFGLMDVHLVKAVFAVPDSGLKQIALGRTQAVQLDIVAHPLQGTVTGIAPEADPKGRVFSVEVTLANPSGDVRPGMVGTLLLGAPATSHVVVALGAVVRATDNPSGFAVFRVVDRGGKTIAVAQTIEIGQTFGNTIEVTRGLAVGDRVVVLGSGLLRDGQEVRILP